MQENMAVEEILGNIGTGTAIANGTGGLINGLFGEGGLFGHSSWYRTLKNAEAQNQANQEMAMWNLENVTKPVFNMENEEWNRRFGEQNTEWERQWNMQNEYNSPKEQLKRWQEIGGNPADFIGNAGIATAAEGNIGNPTVNEAASQMAQPADLASIQNAQTEQRAKNMYAFNQMQQALKQSIDNLTEGDFRARQLDALGISINLGKSQIGKTDAEKTQILADMYGMSARGQELLASAKLSIAKIDEVMKHSALMEEEKRKTTLEGDYLAEELNWLPFEKYFGLSESKARFIETMQRAGANAAQANMYYEMCKTEMQKQKYIGMQTEGQFWANNIMQGKWQMQVDYQNNVWDKMISFQNEKLKVDTGVYGHKTKWSLVQQIFDSTVGNALKIQQAGLNAINTMIDGYAAYQTKGASRMIQNMKPTISTPGYNTGGSYYDELIKQQGSTYDPMNGMYGF